jgi:hypothetical protein
MEPGNVIGRYFIAKQELYIFQENNWRVLFSSSVVYFIAKLELYIIVVFTEVFIHSIRALCSSSYLVALALSYSCTL